MTETIHEERDIPVIDQVDVLVLGGGPAGYAAAIAAARTGSDVLLIERYGHLGGLGTGGVVLLMDCLFDRQGARWTDGLMWETLERLREINGLYYDHPTYLNVDSELFKIVAEQMCLEAGVRLRYHTWAVDAVMDGQTIQGAILESKAGRQAILAKICIDATGDGDIASFAGAGYELGRMRIALNMKVADVDWDTYHKFVQAEPDTNRDFKSEIRKQNGYILSLHGTPYSDQGIFWVNNPGLAHRDEIGVQDWFEGDLDPDQYRGELNALDPEDLTYVEIEVRQRLLRSVDFYRRNVPGFENIAIVAFASQVGVRDSRRIHGLHLLSKDDIIGRRQFDDAVGLAVVNYARDVEVYQVPHRCLIPQGVQGLLVSGRCISVDDWVINSIRLIPACVMLGQAAGTAASLSIHHKVPPAELPPLVLRHQLTRDSVLFSRQ